MGVPSHNEDERLHARSLVVAAVYLQLHLGLFVQADAVAQFDVLQIILAVVARVEVLAGGHCGLLNETVSYGGRKGVFVDDITEADGLSAAVFFLRGCRQLEAEQGLQFVDGAHARIRAVAVRFVHQHHKVVESGQILEVAFAQKLRKAADARHVAACVVLGELAVLVVPCGELGDIEDVYVDVLLVDHAASAHDLIRFAGDDARRGKGEVAQPLEDVLGGVWRKVCDELLVDGQVRRDDEEVLQAVRHVQVADEGPHEPGLAHAGGKGKAQGGKVAVETVDVREFGPDALKLGGKAGPLGQRGDFADGIEYFQRIALRFAQAEPIRNGVHVADAHASSPGARSNREGWSRALSSRGLAARPPLGARAGRAGVASTPAVSASSSSGGAAGRLLMLRL